MGWDGAPLGSLGPDVLFDAIREATDGAEIGLALTLIDHVPPKVIFVNEGAAKITGYSVNELVTAPVWAYVAPEEHGRLQMAADARRRGERLPRVVRTTILHKTGERIPVEIASSQIQVTGQRASFSFFFDIRHRQRAEQALLASQAQFRALIEQAPDGVAILRGPNIIFLNPIAARMLGMSRAEDGVGRNITDFLHPDDAGRAAIRIRELLATGVRPPEPAEYRSRGVDGRELTVEISSIPMEYEGAPAVLAFARDITERKAMQGRLMEADRLAALGVLSAGVAHEINNPLAYVLLNLGFLVRELPHLTSDPSRLDQLMTRAKDACHGAERVATIVRDLRTFARGDEGAREAVDVRKLVDAALAVAAEEISMRARIVRDYAPVPAVEGNANRLEQVFLNLLLNAAQAIPHADPEHHAIKVRIRHEGSSVLVTVEDTGTGIPDDVLGRIFEPFFTTKPVGVGTGLGLPICRGIVRAQGGEISVRTRVGEGSTFTVSLPASAVHAQPAEDAASPLRDSAPARPRGSVLIVDDEAFLGRTLRVVLEEEHELTLATSGAEALRAIRSRGRDGSFDAILCDLMMPSMSGMDLYQVIRREYPGLEERMVFMTGGVALRRASEFLGSITNPTFEKPFDLDTLRATLRTLVDASHAGR